MTDHAEMRTVKLADSTVTMAPVEDLRSEARSLERQAASLAVDAEQLRADSVARFVEAGMILVGRAGEWTDAHPESVMPLAHVQKMIKAIDDADADESAKRTRQGGLFGFKKATADSPEERQVREERGNQLRVMLAELGRGFGSALPAVAQVHGKAGYMVERANTAQGEVDLLMARSRLLHAEADLREKATREMGLDALYLAGQLQLNEPPAAKTALDLRLGERAYLAQAADLARQKTVASTGAGTQGFTFPASQTGIPYLVGSYRGESLRTNDLSRLGTGSFVVTNQRLGFVGDLKSFSFPLSSLRHVVQYTDGLLLIRDGRENGDVLLTGSAGLVLFYINYVLQLQAG